MYSDKKTKLKKIAKKTYNKDGIETKKFGARYLTADEAMEARKKKRKAGIYTKPIQTKY